MNVLNNNFVQACAIIVFGIGTAMIGHFYNSNDLSIAGISLITLAARHMDSTPPSKEAAVAVPQSRPVSLIKATE